MPLFISLTFAAAMALINLWLASRVVRLRYSKRVSIGDGDDPLVQARMRAHANFNEYVPICLIMMALIEAEGGSGRLLWGFGAALVAGRLLHPFGLEMKAPNAPRAIAMLLTWGTTLGLAGWAFKLVAKL